MFYGSVIGIFFFDNFILFQFQTRAIMMQVGPVFLCFLREENTLQSAGKISQYLNTQSLHKNKNRRESYESLQERPQDVTLSFSNAGGIHFFKVNNGQTRTICGIYSKLAIKAPERRHGRRILLPSFHTLAISIDDFEQVNDVVLVSSLSSLIRFCTLLW